MARPARLLPVLLTSSLVLLAGCSGDDPATDSGSTPSSTEETSPETSVEETTEASEGEAAAGDDVVAWAGDFCTAMGPLIERMSDPSAFAPDMTDPAAGIEGLQTFVGDLGSLFREATSTVTDVGAPPVDNGDAALDEMLNIFNTAADSFDEMAAQLEGVDPNDPASFEAIAPLFQELGTEMEASSQVVDGVFSSPEMSAAIEEAPACADMDMLSGNG